MKYIKSQSFHTLNHWQSGRKKVDGIYTDYIKSTTGFFINGLLDNADIVLFPWSLREADAIEGETWKNSSSISDNAWYISPALMKIAAVKFTTANGYDIYYKIEKAGENIETIPDAVPYEADGDQTVNYDILIHQDGNLIAHTNGATVNAVEVYENSFTFGSDYVGKVALPVVNRYKLSWNFYEAGTTDIADWCAECEDKGSTEDELTNHTKWSTSTIYDISRICARNHPYRPLWEVPRLKGLSCIKWEGGYEYYRWGTIRGGTNAEGGAGNLYRAGLGNTIAFRGNSAMAFIITGFSGYNSVDRLAYSCKIPNSSATVDQAVKVSSCIFAGDMGIQNKGQATETEWYMPERLGYNNRLYPWQYKTNADDGIETIVRRVHDIKIQEGFKFFQ